jgi:hypothetical protein
MSGLPDDGQGPLVEKGMDVIAVKSLVAAGESDSVEFKKSTAELPRVGETLCAFLNGHGGIVLIGAAPDGRLLGQEVSDSTLRDVAAMLDRFEPAVKTELERVGVDDRHSVLVLTAPSAVEDRPFVWSGRPYRRVGTTTSRMPQAQFERLLLPGTRRPNLSPPTIKVVAPPTPTKGKRVRVLKGKSGPQTPTPVVRAVAGRAAVALGRPQGDRLDVEAAAAHHTVGAGRIDPCTAVTRRPGIRVVVPVLVPLPQVP